MVKLKIYTNKKTGQKTIFLPKKEMEVLKKNPNFLEIRGKKVRFI